jgi:hypothetical protein
MPRRLQLKRYTLEQPRSRRIKPPQRVDISKLPARERKECLRLGDAASQWLTRKQDNPAFSEEELCELGIAMRLAPHEAFERLLQALRYTTGYPAQPIANAFAPRIQKGNTHRKRKRSQDAEELRRRPPIISVEEPERSHIIAYAARIEQLLDYKGMDNILPDGSVADVAIAFGYTERQVREDVKHLGKYKAKYTSAPAAEAFTPLPTGRIRRRSIPIEILDDIRDARLNTSWLSANRDHLTYVPIKQQISGQLIHDLISQLHPNYDRSQSTTYRILQEVDQQYAANRGVARSGLADLQRHAPWRDNKPAAPGIRVQLDIRSLPTVVDYNGIRCTVRYVAIRDDFSRFRPVWMLLPAKRVDDKEEVHRQDFTARQIRQLFALYCLVTETRMHIIYPDNGCQWSKAALEPYLQFLVAAEEEPTRLVSRRRGRPRGGGGIERELQLIDAFLKHRPAYILEEEYRRSLSEMPKRTIPKFEELVKDFTEHHKGWNYDPYDDQPSYYSIWKQGPDRSLSMPSLANLAVFASLSRRLQAAPDPGGFRIGKQGKKYEPWNFSDEQYKALTNASYNGQELSVLVFEFDNKAANVDPVDPIVFFSLDPDEIIWHLAVEKGQKKATGKRWSHMLVDLEANIEKENASIAQLFLRKLMTAQNGPFVIDAFGRSRDIVALQTNVSNIDGNSAESANPTEGAPNAAANGVEDRLVQLGRNIKVENSSLEAARLLNQPSIDTSGRKRSGGRKKAPSDNMKQISTAEQSGGATGSAGISISADELARLMAADAELIEQLKQLHPGE